MRLVLAAVGGFVVGVLSLLALNEVWDVLARLDRIERYLTQVSQMLRG